MYNYKYIYWNFLALYDNYHYNLLFTKKHKAQKIHDSLILDSKLNNSNITNIIDNNNTIVDKNKNLNINLYNKNF